MPSQAPKAKVQNAFTGKSLSSILEPLKNQTKPAATKHTLGREVYVRREYTLGEDNWPKHGSAVEVKTGGQITLAMDADVKQTDIVFPINYPKLAEMVEVGDLLYVGRYLVTGADEASLYLEVQSKTVNTITCVAHNDAKLDGLLTVFHMERSEKGITNKPNAQALLSKSDVEWIKAISAEFDIDFLSLSYTRHSADVHEARAFMGDLGLESCKIVAKLDAKQSLVNFRGILDAADGIMLSRGNLGLDCLPEKISVIQKNVTTSCNLVGKPCVVTRIMDSMASAPRPTRAEATDVANAVLDGADCLMLGAETLRGMDPVNAVKTVVQCCQAAELEFNHTQHFDYLMREAMKAEDVGIMVPGGHDHEEVSSPGGSSHGAAEALAAMHGTGSANGSVASGLGGPSAHGAHPPSNLANSQSHANLSTSLKAMTRQAPSSANLFSALGGLSSRANLQGAGEDSKIHMSFLSKLEAMASSSVRVAEKAAAKLLIVFTDTGLTSALVAKYRPTVPILTLVIPRLVNQDLQWKVVGRHVARQCLLTRGLQPMLAAPSPDGEQVLRDAVKAATSRGLLLAGDHAVCVEKISGDYCIKMVSVDDSGVGVKELNPLSGPAHVSCGNVL